MSITLSDWFYEGVLMDGGVLAIDPAYFGITGGRERWLYRIARKHAGGAGDGGFAISLPTLFDKSGAEGTYRRFKFEIAKIAKADELPGFVLRIEDKERGEPHLRMIRRDLVTDEGVVVAAPKPKRTRKPKASAELPLFRHLSDETIALCRKAHPGWDVYGTEDRVRPLARRRRDPRAEELRERLPGVRRALRARRTLIHRPARSRCTRGAAAGNDGSEGKSPESL